MSTNHPGLAKCNTCGAKSKPLRKCAACRYIQYCDKTCQTADWPAHKLHCKDIAEFFAAYPEERYVGKLDSDISICHDKIQWKVRRLEAPPTGNDIKLKEKPFTAIHQNNFL
ncbi:hypothetical protein LTR95_012951 [Oleoguttula sp. CCFEE 5521]